MANFHKKKTPQNKRAVPECRAISDAGENLNLQEYQMKRTISECRGVSGCRAITDTGKYLM